jgi:anti-sigma factor RsiW
MTHDKRLEDLVAYLDGELGPGETTALEAELRDDPELARELDSLRKTDALLDLYPEPTLDVDLASRVMARTRRPGRLVRFAPLAALAAMLLIAAFLVIGPWTVPEPIPTPPEPAPAPELVAIENLHALEYMDLLDEAGGDAAALEADVELLLSLHEEELAVAR